MTQTDANKTIVVGIFGSEEAAIQAVAQLHREGYSTDDVKTVAEKNPEANEPGDVKAETVTKSYKGLVIGAIVGGIIGAVIGLSFSGGIFPMPQIALLQALGSVGITLVGLFIGVALGILGGSMSGLSWTQQSTKGLEKAVQAGGWLVTLQNTDLETARAALRKAGAVSLKTQTATPTQVKKT